MRKSILFMATALIFAASCSKPDEEPVKVDPKLSLAESSIVIESTGGEKNVKVEANNSWTAEVTSGTEWLTVSTDASSLTVKASASTLHQTRMGSVTVKSEGLSAVLSVTQLAAENNDKIEINPASLTFESEGGSQNVSVTANVTVQAVSSENWLTVTAPSSQTSPMNYSISAEKNTATSARTATVTFSGGDAPSVTLNVTQNPAAFITVSVSEISAPADGSETKVNVTSNVDWEAAVSESWVSVSPVSGKNTEITVTVAKNEAEQVRTAVVTLSKGDVKSEIKVSQEGAEVTPPTPVEEKLLATWRCDSAEYTEAHSPDWSTTGANDYSKGNGLGIGLPEDGAPAGTKMSWNLGGKHSSTITFITAAEGHYAVKPVGEADGYLFTIPEQDLKKGQVVTMDCAIALGANTSPKNWVIKFRTSESDDWTVGESETATTTASGATAHMVSKSQKDYTPTSRFKATYTIPANLSKATLQVIIVAADAETLNGKAMSANATVRLTPLWGASGAEYPGPRITIK